MGEKSKAARLEGLTQPGPDPAEPVARGRERRWGLPAGAR